MLEFKKVYGSSPEEIYEKLERNYGQNYKITNKDKRIKYSFPISFKREYVFEYETTKLAKINKESLIENLIRSKSSREDTLRQLETEENNEFPNYDFPKFEFPKVEVPVKKPVVFTTELTKVYDYLAEQEIEKKWLDELIEKANQSSPLTVGEWMDSINQVIESELKDWKEEKDFKILTLFGTTGVGKTTTLIKIMNRLKSGNKKIGVITTDNFRVGAYEQMKNYSEKLDFPLIQSNVEELEIPVNVFIHQKGMDYILIDTYGRNSKDENMKSELENYIKTINPENVCLVLAANQKYKDMLVTIRAYNGVNINQLIITKLDETDSFGFIYNLSKELGIDFSYLTFGQNVPNDIELFNVKEYTKKLWKNFSY